MSINIIETVGTKRNSEVQKWYEDKIKELAHFLGNKAKEQTIYTEEPLFTEQKELEVMVR
ncbi:hypothetical protein ACFL0T_07320 [Candidatus Omnitrophota bacterium]